MQLCNAQTLKMLWAVWWAILTLTYILNIKDKLGYSQSTDNKHTNTNYILGYQAILVFDLQLLSTNSSGFNLWGCNDTPNVSGSRSPWFGSSFRDSQVYFWFHPDIWCETFLWMNPWPCAPLCLAVWTPVRWATTATRPTLAASPACRTAPHLCLGATVNPVPVSRPATLRPRQAVDTRAVKALLSTRLTQCPPAAPADSVARLALSS